MTTLTLMDLFFFTPELEGDEDFKHDYFVWENSYADYSHAYIEKFELYE